MATLEQRVEALEREVTRLKAQIVLPEETEQDVYDVVSLSNEEIKAQIDRIRQATPPPPCPEPTAPDFLDRFAGIFADDSAFPEIVRYSEEKRERERQAVNRGK